MTELKKPQSTLLTRLLTRVSVCLDNKFGWDKLPIYLSLPVLIGQRILLREKNLTNTGGITRDQHPELVDGRERFATSRTPDGTYNDLDYPDDGQRWRPLRAQRPALNRRTRDPDDLLLQPNPRTVSRELLARDTFKPATTLNLLAAAWLQFMVHDWMSHGKNESENPWIVPIADDDAMAGAAR